MKKLEKRAILCLILVFCLAAGMGLFVFRYIAHGDEWATHYANQHIYKDGMLGIGRIYDRNGVLLLDNTLGSAGYNADWTTRVASAHAVGDRQGNVGTSAEAASKDDIVGYDIINGTYSISGRGNDVKLSIDSNLNNTAYSALGGRSGFVAVYNYETGEIVCMVSTPSFDPASPPSGDSAASGTFMNKFLSGRFSPGSIFKLVTAAAALETLPQSTIDSFTYTCTGSREVNGEKITCTAAHGTVDFYGALSHSCNCAYAEITLMVGPEKMVEYAEKLGLTSSYDIDGVKNVGGAFTFPSDADINLAWAGIGQYRDELNPCSMLVYMGAIARDGKSVVPRLRKTVLSGKETGRLIDKSTADELKKMMKNNVVSEYGEWNFPGLDIYAKSGTAEVAGRQPNAWFAGFIANEGYPYAFIVCVENGGFGSQVAAPIANRVLQQIVSGS